MTPSLTISADNPNTLSGTAPRYIAVVIGLATLSLSCWWIAPLALSQQAELAAQVGTLRGDLWKRAGWALMREPASSSSTQGKDAVRDAAEDAFRRALERSPMDSEAWFGLALATQQLGGPTSSAALKMSYYTGFNTRALLADRLMLLASTDISGDPELQDMMRRQVALILNRLPELEPILKRAYSIADTANRQLIARQLRELGKNPQAYFGRSS
jgi:hypothetical protein